MRSPALLMMGILTSQTPARVILDHSVVDVQGEPGQDLGLPVLRAASLILAAHGVEEILVPASAAYVKDDLARVHAHFAPTLARRIKPIDKNGTVLKRAEKFFAPVRDAQIDWKKHPGSSTVATDGIHSLYHLLLARDHSAISIGGGLRYVVSTLPHVDVTLFSPEAQYRLAAFAGQALIYEPTVATRLQLPALTSAVEEEGAFVDLIEESEFADVCHEHAKVGYLLHPIVGLRRLRQAMKRLVSHRKAQPGLALADAAALVAAPGLAPGALAKDLVGANKYTPPLCEMPSGLTARILRTAVALEGMKARDDRYFHSTNMAGMDRYGWIQPNRSAEEMRDEDVKAFERAREWATRLAPETQLFAHRETDSGADSHDEIE